MSLFRRKKKANDEIFIASFNRSNATVTDSELTEVFSEVGSRYGYADVKAKFKALKDFKVQWQRSYKWAGFTISPYGSNIITASKKKHSNAPRYIHTK